MLLPTLELPDIFVLFNQEDHFVEINEDEADVDFIKDSEGKTYIGIRIYGQAANSSNAYVIDIFQEKDAVGEHIYQVYENNTELQLSDYHLTKPSIQNTVIANLESIFCSSYLFNEI